MISTKKQSKIPVFTDKKEEAIFWETHSIADFMDELQPVKARFAKNLSEGIHVPLDPATLTKLRSKAKDKGIDITALVRMWIMEQLHISYNHA